MGAWEDGFAAGWSAGMAEGSSPVYRGQDRRKISKIPARTPSRKKPKRKLTPHNRFMKKEMKALRRKHPRMKQPQIMKKANVAWRKHKRSKR